MNASQEAQAWANYELDRDWHAAAVVYGGGDLDPEPLTEAERAAIEEGIRTYRERKAAACLAAGM